MSPAFTDTAFNQFMFRIAPALIEKEWVADRKTTAPAEWRQGPPYAFDMHWAAGSINAEQYSWFRAQGAFPRLFLNVQEEFRDGRVETRNLIRIYPLTPQPKPVDLYHATPSANLGRIMAEGLRPARATGVCTTNFRDTQQWVHVFAAITDVEDGWLNQPEGRKLIPAGEYVVLRVDPAGVGELYCDPASRTGFVLADDRVEPALLTEVKRVTVADGSNLGPRDEST